MTTLPKQAPRMAAWAHAITVDDVLELRERLPAGFGFVLRAGNYHAALEAPGGRFYAFVNNAAQAREVASLIGKGAAFRAAILMDERNVRTVGPSGPRMAPAEYALEYRRQARILTAAGVPVSPMGLVWQPGRRTLGQLGPTAFDWPYLHELDAELRKLQAPRPAYLATNPAMTPMRRVRALIEHTPGPWLLSPHPFLPVWRPWSRNTVLPWLADRVYDLTVRPWVETARHPHVETVALWSLRQYRIRSEGDRLQAEHSLFTPEHELTPLGRQLLAAMP